MKKYKVLFCDLDDTLIDTVSGKTFPEGIWDMKLKFDVLDAIKKFHPEVVCIVTNQGGIEKGFVNKEDWVKKADYICACIKEYTGSYATYRYCASNDKDCPKRKPNVGMLQRFMDLFSDKFDKSDCLMIGDASGKPDQFSDSDIETAENFDIAYLDVKDFVTLMSYEDKISDLLKDTDDEHHLKFEVTLDPEEAFGLCSVYLPHVEEIWKNSDGEIMLKMTDCEDPIVPLRIYADCTGQVYKALCSQLKFNS